MNAYQRDFKKKGFLCIVFLLYYTFKNDTIKL